MCSPVEFWQKVAFCNLVQESMDSASAVPSLENFARGWRALRRTVAETDPHLIIFFTKRGWDANVLESEAIDLEGVGNNRRTESGVYGLNIYSRPGKHEIVATVANHPRHAMVWQGVWQTWTERAWKEAERIAW
jgi:hypothetical protein